MKRVFILCVFCVFFLSCKSVPKNNGNFLNGMIYDEENEPVPNVLVSVNGEILTSSDVDGHFVLDKDFNENNIKILCTKNDYEEVWFDCELLSVPQVVYIKMYSFDQLLSLAEKELADNKIEDAKKILERAEKIKPNQITTQYLEAICFYKQGDFEKALFLLEGLNSDNKYIELFKEDLRLNKDFL